MPELRTSEIADKGVSLDNEVKRILSAATLAMGEHKRERKKIRQEEDRIFKEELLKAKEQIKYVLVHRHLMQFLILSLLMSCLCLVL